MANIALHANLVQVNRVNLRHRLEQQRRRVLQVACRTSVLEFSITRCDTLVAIRAFERHPVRRNGLVRKCAGRLS